MSISGLGSLLPDPIGPASGDRAGSAEKQLPADAGRGERIGRSSSDAAASTEAGTPGAADPQMWALLTGEERSFYLRSAVRGPATYAPGAHPSPEPIPGHRLGGRIDVRI